MSSSKPKRRRFLVDPELQIGLSAEMVGWIYVYFLVIAVVANAGHLVTLASADPDAAAYLAALDEIRAFARHVVLPMGVTFVAMAVHGVFLTHRIAGPIVRLQRAVRDLGSRRLPGPVVLRRKDHFKGLAEELNVAVGVLREDAARRRKMSDEVVRAATRLVAAVESAGDAPGGARTNLLASAHAVLDSAETLARQLAVSDGQQPAPDGVSPVPLAEADLPAVVSEPIDALEPEACAGTVAPARA